MERRKILSVREQIADVLRSDIISGALEPKTKLNEQQLAEQFGTSRGPVRDALLKLNKEGLIVIQNNLGSSVNVPLQPELQKLSIEIRLKIEEFAIKKIQGTLTDANFEDLEAIIEQMHEHFEAGQFTELTKADISFHRYLVELAGGDDLFNTWYPIVLRMRMNYGRISSSVKLVDEHRDIVKALRNNDTKAAIASLRQNVK